MPSEQVEPFIEHWKGKEGDVPAMIPCPLPGIASTRQFIMDWCSVDVALMLDDDMGFMKRLPGDWRLKGVDGTQMDELLSRMEQYATEHGMCGLSARQGNNYSFPEPVVWNSRVCNAYAIHVETFQNLGIRFDRQKLMEDFHVTLEFLHHSYDVPVITEFAWGQKTSNAPGGCSDYRDGDMQAEAAYSLQKYHGDVVRVVDKKADWPGMQTRKDVRIQWKKARQNARYR